MKVFKWGNGLAVPLPENLIEELGLCDGSELHVVAARPSRIEVETDEDRRRSALQGLASLNWQMPPEIRFDRDEANKR